MHFDKYRLANAFLDFARVGYKDACRNVVYNYSQVYYMPVRDVLALVSIMLDDPEGFEYDEYRKVKTMIRELTEELEQ